MSRSPSLALFAVLLVTSALLGARSWAQGPTEEDLTPKRPTYTIADELRQACEPILKPRDPRQAKVQQYDEYMLFIVPYLDSEDAELRDAAVDILAQLMKVRRHIRASAFKPYLSRDYPINVRVVALAHSLYGFVGQGERGSYPERRAEMEAAWTETLNDIAESAVTPPHFDVLAFALFFRRSDFAAWIEPDSQPVMIRRLLALASSGGKDDQETAMELVYCFPPDIAVSELLAWYGVEPRPANRAMCVDRIASASASLTVIHGRPESDEKLKTLTRFLELAAQDTNAEIAEKAKAALEKANAFLEEQAARSKANE